MLQDVRALTELLEQYQRGDRNPAHVLEIFTDKPFIEPRFTKLHGAFQAILANNMNTDAVFEAYQCATPDSERTDSD